MKQFNPGVEVDIVFEKIKTLPEIQKREELLEQVLTDISIIVGELKATGKSKEKVLDFVKNLVKGDKITQDP